MEIVRSVYTDLIFHIFAHMKVGNASDIYDEAYIASVEKELGRKTVIPESVTAYYCANFERLAFVNFLPYFMAKSADEVCFMIRQVGMTTEEDVAKFIDPFCDVIKELSADYVDYWERKAKKRQIFMQLVHECTHMITDPLLASIRMDDGSHDVAEYQVMLFDLWLFERDDSKLRDEYVKWLSQETLDECDQKLSEEQKKKLRALLF